MSERCRFGLFVWVFAGVLSVASTARAQDAAFDGGSDAADDAAVDAVTPNSDGATGAVDVAVVFDGGATGDGAGSVDLGVPRDAGADTTGDAATDAGARDGGSDAAPRVPPLDVGDDDGCSYGGQHRSGASKLAGLILLGVLVIARRRRR